MGTLMWTMFGLTAAVLLLWGMDMLITPLMVRMAHRVRQRAQSAAGGQRALLEGMASGFETSSRQFFRPIRPSFWHRLWAAYRQGGWPKVLETLRQDERE